MTTWNIPDLQLCLQIAEFRYHSTSCILVCLVAILKQETKSNSQIQTHAAEDWIFWSSGDSAPTNTFYLEQVGLDHSLTINRTASLDQTGKVDKINKFDLACQFVTLQFSVKYSYKHEYSYSLEITIKHETLKLSWIMMHYVCANYEKMRFDSTHMTGCEQIKWSGLAQNAQNNFKCDTT